MKTLKVGDKVYNFERKETITKIVKSKTNPNITRYMTVTKNGSPNMFTSQDLCTDAKDRIVLIK